LQIHRDLGRALLDAAELETLQVVEDQRDRLNRRRVVSGLIREHLSVDELPKAHVLPLDAFEARGNFNGHANLVRWALTGTSVGTTSSNWSWIYNVQSTDHGEFGSEGPRSAHPREGDWMCLEWSMDAAAQEARFWFDGVEVDYLHIDTERAEIPVFDTFNIGFQKFQTSGAWTVWVDEVAFDDQRIGCDG